MKTGVRWYVGIAAAVMMSVLLLGSVVVADEAADGRSICTKCSAAVVRVMLVAKMTMSYEGQSDSREQKYEAVGTVIDPSGLIVTSLARTDPSSSSSDEDDEGYQMSSEIKDVKIVQQDGKEVPAKVVLRDRDLDLMFIRPVNKPANPTPCVDMKDTAKAEILDKVLVVTRLSKVANRVLSACIERIQSVVEKPRKFYSVGLSSMGDEYGSPVFSMSGKLVGIVLNRDMPGVSEEDGPGGMPVVIPADDILSVAAQAPEDAPKATETEKISNAK
jgi:S1-C subfamily serine protease